MQKIIWNVAAEMTIWTSLYSRLKHLERKINPKQ